MHAFDVLGDPVRRRILELLATREHASGDVVAVIGRESGFASVRPEGARRVYVLDTTPMRDVDDWLARFRGFWTVKLEALATEVERGKRTRRAAKR